MSCRSGQRKNPGNNLVIPNPQTKPAWLPVRLVLLGAAVSCGALACGRVPSSEWPRFLAGLSVVGADGTTLGGAMSGRVGTTMMLVLASVLIAVTAGLAVSLTAVRAGFGLPWLAGLCGRLLAALPVVAVIWLAVGWIVGQHGWPVESLLPHHPAPGHDHWNLALGRRLWWWLVPCWVLVPPLMGEFVSQTLDRFADARTGGLIDGLRARGLKRSTILYHHQLPAVWPDLLGVIQALGLLALGYVVFVEEALGIQGWGSFVAAAIKSGDVRGIAGSIYTAGWMSAAWCLGIGLLHRLTTPRAISGPAARAEGSGTVTPVATATGLVLVVLSCCAFGEMPALTKLGTLVGGYVSPLVHDLGFVSAACAVALLLALICGGMPAALKWRLPRFGIAGTLSWSPLLVWTLAFMALMRDSPSVWIVPGVVVAFGGAVEVRNRCRELSAGRAIEGSRAIGSTAFRAWTTHVLPDLLQAVLAWLLQTCGTLMVWIALIDSLKTPQPGTRATSLGLAMAAAKENVLGDLTPLLVPAALVTISALFFRQAGRIVRPVPPPC